MDDDVILPVVCDRCGAEFDWRPGVDPDDSSCPECQRAAATPPTQD